VNHKKTLAKFIVNACAITGLTLYVALVVGVPMGLIYGATTATDFGDRCAFGVVAGLALLFDLSMLWGWADDVLGEDDDGR
jgi:predicted MFS family arabinose efflux permease